MILLLEQPCFAGMQELIRRVGISKISGATRREIRGWAGHGSKRALGRRRTIARLGSPSYATYDVSPNTLGTRWRTACMLPRPALVSRDLSTGGYRSSRRAIPSSARVKRPRARGELTCGSAN